MNQNTRYVNYACLMVVLLIPLVLAASGCTTYEVTRTEPGGISTTVSVRSWRNFEQPELHYARGPDSAEFDFGAESATRSVSPIEAGIGKVVEAGGTVILGAPAADPGRD